MAAEVSTPPRPNADEHAWVQARAQLLVEPLAFAERITRRGKGLIGLGLGAAALTGGAAAFSGDDVPAAARRAQGLGAGLLALGEVCAIVGPEEDSLRFQLAAVYAWDASILGLWLASSSRAPALSTVALTGGYYSSAALALIDALASQRTPNPALELDLSRVSSPTERESLTAADIAQFERDVHGARGVIPRALIPLPTVVGSLLAMAPAADGSLDRGARRDALGLGIIGLSGSAIALFVSCVDPIGAYDRATARLPSSVSVQVLPGAAFVSWTGRF